VENSTEPRSGDSSYHTDTLGTEPFAATTPHETTEACAGRLLESRAMADNKLFYGDNLDVLRRYVRDESVDLIYLDPPFNSRQDYNVLFAEKDGTRSSSQITAFEDTWEWDLDAERAYQEVVERGGWVVEAFGTFFGHGVT